MIRRIKICNFKSLRGVAVDLEPVTVFIGRSGTGKTNLVYALRFLRDYLAQGDQVAGNMGGWPHLLCATRAHPGELSFELDFEAPNVDGVCAYTLSFAIAEKSHGTAFSGESLRIGGRTVFAQKGGHWIHPPELVEPPRPVQKALGLLYGIPEARVAYIVLTKGLACYDFPGDVLSKGSFNPAEGIGLNDNGSNYLTALDGIVTNLEELGREREMLAALQRLNRAITSVELTVDRSHVRVGHKVGDAKVLSFELAQESEGFRRFLAHMIALYQQQPRQTLVFEEPEKGIYPGALAVLAEHFQAVAKSRRLQVLLTTHSPELLKHFRPEQIRVVTMEGYETKIGPVAPEQRASLEEHLMTADELLTVDEARIDTAGPSA